MHIEDPHSHADTRQGQIRHIDFDLDIDFEAKVVRGTADYTLEGAGSESLFLDTRGVQVDGIFSGDTPLTWTIDENDRIKGQRLHIRKPASLANFRISFASAAGASALGWLEPKHTFGGKHPFLLSQCQAIHARSVFPCQDTPSVRFTYTAKVRVPSPLTAAMSAERIGIEKDGDHVICRFKMPQAIPSYLFAIAAGNIAFRDLGPRFGVFAEPEILEEAAWEFGDTEKTIGIAESLFGPYLWDRFNILILPPSFPYGGMENPRLAFLTPTLLVGDKSMVNVVAHELAHSWTGNLVTNATWEDFWLNEGWTVFAERRILEVLEGEPYAQLHAAVRRESMLQDMRGFGMDSDPTKLKFSQKDVDPDEVFSMVPYEKGCSFLTLLESTVGRARFDEFIRAYIEKYRFQSVSTEEFLSFLASSLPEVEGKVDIKEWVYGAGFPADAPQPTSPLLDAVHTALKSYENGTRPARDQVGLWKPQQVELFFKGLPAEIPIDDCRYFESLFGLKTSRNRNILTAYYVVAIQSAHTDILPEVERLLSSVGRMLYLKPLYRALIDTPWSREQARPIFERCRETYHPIAVGVVDRILAQDGV